MHVCGRVGAILTHVQEVRERSDYWVLTAGTHLRVPGEHQELHAALRERSWDLEKPSPRQETKATVRGTWELPLPRPGLCPHTPAGRHFSRSVSQSPSD